jgi:hypothetical protein
MAICYILYVAFWYIFHALVCCAKKNLATLLLDATQLERLSLQHLSLVGARQRSRTLIRDDHPTPSDP